MTRIDFYLEAANPFLVTQKLVSKSYQGKHSVWIRASSQDEAKRLDDYLWAEPITGFLPHCLHTAEVAIQTPVLIAWGDSPPTSDAIGINLGHEVDPHFSRFERYLEVISLDPTAIQKARLRYRHYQQRGYQLHTHHLAPKN